MSITTEAGRQPKASGATSGALSGIKIIDLTRVLAGPYCTMNLADHGADVIKVEPPQGDDARDFGPPFFEKNGEQGDSGYFIGVNRNKRSIALDFWKPEGKQVLMRLLQDADVLIENFKPGTMERFGLDYETGIAPNFPRLVHCRISGFGAEGPLGGLPGYDYIVQAMTGVMSMNGAPSTGPLRLSTPVVDLGTGLYSMIGILMALVERQRSGRGQFIDMTLYDCGMAMLYPQASRYLLDGIRPVPIGNSHPIHTPCGKFKARNGDVFITVANDGQFRKLAEQVGMPELTKDERFKTIASRLKNDDELCAILAPAIADQDCESFALQLLKAGVSAAPVLPIDQVIASEHTAVRRMLVDFGDYRGLGTPIKFSRTPGSVRRPPPRFAEQTQEILSEIGYSSQEIASLCDSGGVCTTRR